MVLLLFATTFIYVVFSIVLLCLFFSARSEARFNRLNQFLAESQYTEKAKMIMIENHFFQSSKINYVLNNIKFNTVNELSNYIQGWTYEAHSNQQHYKDCFPTQK